MLDVYVFNTSVLELLSKNLTYPHCHIKTPPNSPSHAHIPRDENVFKDGVVSGQSINTISLCFTYSPFLSSSPNNESKGNSHTLLVAGTVSTEVYTDLSSDKATCPAHFIKELCTGKSGKTPAYNNVIP